MKIIDISMDIHPLMPVYKNKEEKKPLFQNVSSHENSTAHETVLSMNLHTGTHIDAPLHMIKNGATMENYSLSTFYTSARVLDFTTVSSSICKDDLILKNIQPGEFLLLKTKNSYIDTFDFDFVYLDKTASMYLQEIGIKGVGIDALGIERNQDSHPTHKILLGNNIPIVEGLRLKEVNEKTYQLIVLPLKIRNVEASPARAVLIDNE